MTEGEMQNALEPIHRTMNRMIPGHKVLLDFIGSKTQGSGTEKALQKIRLLEKSEQSTYTCMNVEMTGFRKRLQDKSTGTADGERLTRMAEDILKTARQQVKKVYGDVRRQIISSELKADFIEKHYRLIPGLTEEQNELVAEEILRLICGPGRRPGNQASQDSVTRFCEINRIGARLFAAVAEGKGNTGGEA